MNPNGEWDWEGVREGEVGQECGWENRYGGENNYIPKAVLVKFVFLNKACVVYLCVSYTVQKIKDISFFKIIFND